VVTLVPRRVLTKLRAICLRLPGAYEEQAWVGTRWMIRKRNFAHVVKIERGWPPAYARAAHSDGPLVVVTFRTTDLLSGAFSGTDPRFFLAEWGTRWGTKVAGMALGERVNWDEFAVLIAESYRLLAPKNLVAEELTDRRRARGSRRPAGSAKPARTRATRGESPKSTRGARRSASARRS